MGRLVDFTRREGVRWSAWRQAMLFRAACNPIELPLQLPEETLVRCGLLLAATFVPALAMEQLNVDHIDQAPFVIEAKSKKEYHCFDH